MIQLIRSLSAPLLSLILLILGSGLFNTFWLIRLELAHYSAETIGGVTAALYVGIHPLFGKLGRWIEKVGHIRAFTIFAIVSTFLVLAQALWIHPIYWGILRLILRHMHGGRFHRHRKLGTHAKPFLRTRSRPFPLPRCFLWRLVCRSIPDQPFRSGIDLYLLYRGRPLCSFDPAYHDPEGGGTQNRTFPTYQSGADVPDLSFRFSWGRHFGTNLLAVIYGLVPIYARESGMGISEIGTLMSVIIFGGLSFQWPIGRWADKTDRRRVLNTASFMTTIFAIAIALMGESPWLLLLLGRVFWRVFLYDLPS